MKGGLQRLREEQAAISRALKTAQRHAAATRAAAEKAARRICRAAYREGLRTGAAAVARIQGELQAFLAGREADLPLEAAELALHAARRILDVEFQLRPEAIVDLVRTALGGVRFCRDIRIVVSPEDYAVLAPYLAGGESQGWTECKSVQWVQQSDAARGTLRILTNRGSVDAGIDRQLQQLADRLHCAASAENPEASVA